MNLHEFFHMDGYGMYIWPSYAVALIVLVGNVVAARRALRRSTEEALRRSVGGKS